jgi:hypothetical protein
MTNRKIQDWVIPLTEDGEFVAHMEEGLDIYAQPYNPKCPVICMDQRPVQLQREVRTPIAAVRGTLCRLRQDHSRLRPTEHSHQGGFLRSL